MPDRVACGNTERATRILSINIRATQGGAGRMGYDLHGRLRTAGHDVQLLYGYGSSIAPDPLVADESDVRMIGSRMVVLTNYVSHWAFGREVLTGSAAALRLAIDAADVVHVHAAHHWYLRWDQLISMLRARGCRVVMTAHDWWLVSGRCGFARDCTGWQRTCGECGRRRFEDLPSLPDRSRAVRAARHGALRKLGNQLTIACPSRHLARDHAMVFPDIDIAFVPNALDRGFEAVLAALTIDKARTGYLFCASDLNSPGKIDAALVRRMAATLNLPVAVVGRDSPFGDIPAVNDHGEVRDRATLAELFASARALIFTSQMDNAPLTIIEALSAGCFVVAYPSPAAQEMVELVGGRCTVSPEEAYQIASGGSEAELYGGITATELAARARAVWSGEGMMQSYLNLYAARGRGCARENAV